MLDDLLEVDAALGLAPEIPVVTRAKPKPEAGAGEDSISLEALEVEFQRDETGMAEVDAALDSVLGPGAIGEDSLPSASGGTKGEGAGAKWRTIVRFLGSF